MILLIIVACLIIINMLLISFYCTFRKKNKKEYKIAQKQNNTINKEEKGFITVIKKMHNKYVVGWIRYQCILVGKIPSHHIRLFCYKNIFRMNLDQEVVIYGGCEFRDPWNISIGKGSIIGNNVQLDGRNGIIIGKNVNMSSGVWIWTQQHDVNDPLFRCFNENKTVIIEDYVWLSCRTIILPGIKIGKGSVIAAGAVVTKDCSEYAMYGGIPAKYISARNQDLEYEFTSKKREAFY